ncbi:unnamed protein product, partial [Prorocentrum cordatum]
ALEEAAAVLADSSARSIRAALRDVVREAFKLNAAAALGARHGPAALAAFVRVFTRGRLAAADAALWGAAVLAPDNQGKRRPDRSWKFRPVGLMEAPVKFAEGIAVGKYPAAVRRRINPSALGLAPERAPMHIKTLRGWAAAMAAPAARAEPEAPGDPLVAALVDNAALTKIDLENACGRLQRAGAPRRVREVAAPPAKLLALQWKAGSTRIWIRVGDAWRCLEVWTGGVQGSFLIKLAFDIVIHAFLTGDVIAEQRRAPAGLPVTIGVADDWASATLRIVVDWQPALAAENQRLVPGRCAAFLPAVDSGLEPLSQRGAELCQLASRSFGGLKAAFWARRASVEADVLTVSAGLGRPLATHPDAPAAGRARGELESAGICVRLGRIAFTDKARLEYEAGPWAAHSPTEAVFDFCAEAGDIPGSFVSLLAASQDPEAEGRARGGRRWLAARAHRDPAALAATWPWRRSSAPRRAHMPAGGGLGAGAFSNGFTREGEAVLSDAAFVVVFRRRLLLDLPGAPTTRAFEYSRHAASGEEGQQGACGRPLDVAGYRALRCPVGPHRSWHHSEVARALAEWISSHGGHVDIARCVPELHRRRDGGVIEERLDLEWLVGHAAADAERRKRDRHGAAAWPFAAEAEGRLGAAAQQFIAASAAAARHVATLPGEPGGQQGADYARQLASRVSGALVARLADLLLAAMP